MILILSNKWDITVDFVVRELRQKHYPFLRLNTEDLAKGKATVTLPDFHIYVSKQDNIHDLSEEVHVIWNRRPGKTFDDIPKEKRPSQATQDFINNQWYSWLEVLQIIPNVSWINHPQSNDAMESKIRQLWLAKNMGFRIPTTIVSNDPIFIKEQFEGKGDGIIAKALYSPLIEEPEQDFFIFTNEIKEINLDDADKVRLSPIIFQMPLMPKTDYRVTVIGDTVIPAKIESERNLIKELDWRTQKDGLKFNRCNLPKEIEKLCCNYVKQNNLIFGAIDLVEHNGEFVFLEINPNGEWGWLQKPYGLPIAEVLCDLMIHLDKKDVLSNVH